MKATLKLNGKEYEVEVSEEMAKDLEQPKKTGYESLKDNKADYYYVSFQGVVEPSSSSYNPRYATNCYEIANYYSDETVAENNARADALMRKLRRFAVEHREHELVWKNCMQTKYSIYYDHEEGVLWVDEMRVTQDLGKIYFDSKEKAKTAIEEFKDELIWYFTEYRDSL